jgi:hypothetical protein
MRIILMLERGENLNRRPLFTKRSVIILIVVLLLSPQSVFAYSYGDPNKEDIAEAYVFIKAKLDENPPAWDAAYQQYLVHKKVLKLEFGDRVISTLEANFTAQDKTLLKANYRGMLAMNIKRRFDYAKAEIKNYSQAKLLLAKAKGTFEVIAPYIKDGATVTSVRNAFDLALEALGNPGLFGVGKKDTNEEEFTKQVDLIYGAVKPFFPFAYVKADAPKPAETEQQPTPAADEDAATGTKQTSETSGTKTASDTSKSSGSTDTADSSTQNNAESTSSDTKQEPAEPAVAAPAAAEGTAEQTADAAEPQQANESTADNSAEDSNVTENGDTNSTTVAEASTEAAEPVEQPAADDDQAESDTDLAMDTMPLAESKVNPVVSIIVIGSVVIVAAAGIYFASRRGLFKL